MKRHRTGLTIGFAVIVVAAFAVLLWHPAGWLYEPGFHKLTPNQQVAAIDATRGRLIQFGAGLLAFGALVFTALNFRLSREGHVTDRYTKAIEQLGSKRRDVRLGAIYALERIMVDSRRDHPTIVEVLAAYVREHAQIVNPKNQNPDFGLDPPAVDVQLDPPATDVQAVLTVLGRRPANREERAVINLRSKDLARADLQGAKLRGADLLKARLRDADLSHADLSRADLTGADLTGADLHDADLSDARLTGANLKGANIYRARLAMAFVTGADLTDTNLDDADLTGVNLADAKLPLETVRELGIYTDPDSE